MPGILVNSILLVVNRGSTHWREQSILTDHHAMTTGIKTGLPAQLNQIFLHSERRFLIGCTAVDVL